MNIIFLDIDGVLNNHDVRFGYCDIQREKIDRLNDLLIWCHYNVGETKIVLTSAWRYIILGGAMNVLGFDYMMTSHGLIPNSVIDHTVSDEDVEGRGKQISEWLSRNECDNYVILDDIDLGISPHHSKNFVHTCGTIGLTDEDAEKAKGILCSTEK